MKEHIANTISALRIVGSIALLFYSVLSWEFLALYSLCGFTDLIDGTIARKTNSVSEFGSKLDMVADFIFISLSLIKFLPLIILPTWLWVWIGVIAIIKITNTVMGFVCRKKLVALHTILNKITGLLLFLLPLSLYIIDTRYGVFIVCVIATVAALQENYYIETDRKNN